MAYQFRQLNPCDEAPYICPKGAITYKDCQHLCGKHENADLYDDLKLEQLEQM